MALPKQKISKSRGRKRRSHRFLTAKGTSICPNCNAVKLPRRICGTCGFYGKEPIVDIEDEDDE